MNSEIYKQGDSHVVPCSRGRLPKRCAYCGYFSRFLCDYPIGKNKTCDVPLCLDCTQKGVSKNVDFCRKHFPLAKAAYLRKLEAGKVK